VLLTWLTGWATPIAAAGALGSRESEHLKNPYGCSDERALAWDLGWQSAQTNDELSEYINSKPYALPIELDSEASEELWDLIKKQRWS
jgi:hypothetical protein